MKYIQILFAGLSCSTLPSCHRIPSDDREAATICAQEFTDHFYNYEFDEAYECCTPESRQWLMWHASQLNEEDLAVLNAHPERATTDIMQVEQSDKTPDSMLIATCRINHVWLADSLERPPYFCKQVHCTLALVKREGEWLVKMEGPLRNEK